MPFSSTKPTNKPSDGIGPADPVGSTVTPCAESPVGKVNHTSPEKADELIRKHLAGEAKKGIEADKKIAGKAKVVGEPEWSQAGIAHYGEEKWKAEKVDSLNGFVDKDGNVWVHKDRGNQATMIHEGIHKYSDSKMKTTSQPLNEGMTEYYTRKIAKEEDIAKARANYNGNYKSTKALADLVGEDKISKAYFEGDVEQLKDAVDAKKGEGTWDKYVELTKQKKWTESKDLLAQE